MGRLFLLSLILLVFPLGLAGDGTLSVGLDDTITADNGHFLTVEAIDSQSVTFRIDGTPRGMSVVLGETRFVTDIGSGEHVLEVELLELEEHATAVLRVASVEEAAPPPAPPDEDGPEGKVFDGDGEYWLSIGEAVTADNGVQVSVVNVARGESYDRNGNPIVTEYAYLHVTEEDGSSLPQFASMGDRITVDEGKGSLGNFRDVGLEVRVLEADVEGARTRLQVASQVSRLLLPGWNFVSVPLECESCSEILSSNTCGDVVFWEWTGNTYTKAVPQAGNGYWVKAEDECEISFSGKRITEWRQQLSVGWNVLGGPTASAQLSDLGGTCEIPYVWQYDTGLQRMSQAQFIGFGDAMFVHVDEACEVFV